MNLQLVWLWLSPLVSCSHFSLTLRMLCLFVSTSLRVSILDLDVSLLTRITAEAWVDAVDPTIVIDKDIYIEALQQDLVTLGHNIVRLICASSLCRKAFNNTIITGNQMKWFTDEDGNLTKLPILELIRDVKSRWDSIYLMINCLCTLRQVHNTALSCHNHADFFHRHWTLSSGLQHTKTSLTMVSTKCIGKY